MKLYCRDCNDVHHVTEGEAERIIYALDGMQADASTDNEARVDGDAYQASECPVRVLGYSRDTEMYYEHVEACVDARRASFPRQRHSTNEGEDR